MLRRATISAFALFLGAFVARAETPDTATVELEKHFSDGVRPFLAQYCLPCHSGPSAEAELDLSAYTSTRTVVRDHEPWSRVLEKLTAKEMPPEDADEHPTAEARQRVIDWIAAMRKNEAVANAGDPGVVLARRLSNAEYNYTICDLTGVDMRPAREFPVDPTNPAGFDNSGESLSMSPTLLAKYLQAAREVAEYLVFKPGGIAFAPHPMLVETDRDKYCVDQIMDFYGRQNTSYADYFQAAWRFKHRAALGQPDASLTDVAAQSQVSAKYLATVWSLLDGTDDEIGPIAKLRTMWRELPAPDDDQPTLARDGCERMRDYVVELRKKVEPRFANIAGGRRLGASSQPMLMWKNRQYATHRRTYERAALQIQGEVQAAKDESSTDESNEPGAEDEFGPGRTMPVKNKPCDPDLVVPADQRAEYEAAFAKFCAVFPDAFIVSERGRNYFDKTKDQGRYLSAGFHNVMGYFRDDQPLYELILDEAQQQELDEYWRELDFIASACHRTYTQFYLNEAREAREAAQRAVAEDASDEEREITSQPMIRRVKESFLDRARAGGNEVIVQAVEEHFDFVNDTIRWVEKARLDAEPKHVEAILDLAARAYRRPLADEEREELRVFYRSLREDTGLSHEDAMRDTLVSVLMSPDFCYRIDLVADGEGIQQLSDYALASRLSYFLWSSLPDEELLAHAASGDLHEPEVLTAQARRILQDDRVVRLATEFGGNWLDFRRFEELNTVDREYFASFDDELREAMFQEPIHFLVDVFGHDRSILECVYADHTFVNRVLARHYGMRDVGVGADEWVRVDNARKYGRGGVLPMAAFLTKNAPGLRTSPVKRGYWVVKNMLGEVIPPPPAAVPELPRAEKDLGELTLREVLDRHRADPSCSACHQRFDAMGLVFEGFGPVGERRDTDLAGHTVDARAAFPGGSEGAGVEGLREYIRLHRQDDFIDNLCRKLFAYGLNRSLILSDDGTIAGLRTKLAANDYRFSVLVESIVTSQQFLTKRGQTSLAQQGE
jgi:hypothetical protein